MHAQSAWYNKSQCAYTIRCTSAKPLERFRTTSDREPWKYGSRKVRLNSVIACHTSPISNPNPSDWSFILRRATLECSRRWSWVLSISINFWQFYLGVWRTGCKVPQPYWKQNIPSTRRVLCLAGFLPMVCCRVFLYVLNLRRIIQNLRDAGFLS